MQVLYRQEPEDHEDLALFSGTDSDENWLTLREADVTIRVVPKGAGSEGLISSVQWGDPESIRGLRFHLINFPVTLLPNGLASPDGHWWRGTFSVAGGAWSLRLDTRQQARAHLQGLRADPGYAVTHIGEIRRWDGIAFGPGEIEDALMAVQFSFSFCRSAWTAPMLPVGLDGEGRTVWWEAANRFCTPGAGRGSSWLDPHDADGLASVTGLWLDLWTRPLWREVLTRVTIYHCEANRQGIGDPSFLETKYTLAQAGLELLAWAILDQDPSTAPSASTTWQEGGNRAAERNLRALLHWAKIPSDVPDRLPALRQLQVSRGWDDAAPIIPWLRNQVVHPRRRGGRYGPDTDVVMEGWRLACRYLELVLLRRLGYLGDISRGRLEAGRWVGETEPVPWAQDVGN